MPKKPQLDDFGNIHYTVGTAKRVKTLFSAHIDTVHRTEGQQRILFDDNLEYALLDSEADECLGADDGAGITVLLAMIHHKVPGHYIFHRGEEKGRLGSKWLEDNCFGWLQKFQRAVAFDRRGYRSVITKQSSQQCCSDDFANALADQLNSKNSRFIFEPDPTGSFTDTHSYIHAISECTNISTGYHHEHSSGEFQDCDFLEALTEAVIELDWGGLPVKREPSNRPRVAGYPTPHSPQYGSYYNDLYPQFPYHQVQNRTKLKLTEKECMALCEQYPYVAGKMVYDIIKPTFNTVAQKAEERRHEKQT